MSLLYATLALTVALASGLAARRFWRRSREPFLRLAPEGFEIHGATALIPWTDIEEIGHYANNNGVTVNFLLAEGKSPALGGAHYRRAKYDKARQVLSVSVKAVKSLSGNAYLELVYEYYRGGQARALLMEREAGRVVSHANAEPL